MGVKEDLFIKNISFNEKEMLKIFLKQAGNSLLSFRYYNKRDLSVLKNHILTCLLYLNDRPIGYGHLDCEDGIIWLGIAVIDEMKGKGFGKVLMEYLIEFAKENKIKKIRLSVDQNNLLAIILYKKFGFIEDLKTDKLIFMNKIITD